MSAMTANPGTAVRCKDFSSETPWARLVAVVEKIFPQKTATNLADLSGLKERAAYSFLEKGSPLRPAALIALIKSPHGPDILRALIGEDFREPWWIEFRVMWEKQQKLREIEEWERDLRGIDDHYVAQKSAARHPDVSQKAAARDHQIAREVGQTRPRRTG